MGYSLYVHDFADGKRLGMAMIMTAIPVINITHRRITVNTLNQE
jgi:hypothetical protein